MRCLRLSALHKVSLLSLEIERIRAKSVSSGLFGNANRFEETKLGNKVLSWFLSSTRSYFNACSMSHPITMDKDMLEKKPRFYFLRLKTATKKPVHKSNSGSTRMHFSWPSRPRRVQFGIAETNLNWSLTSFRTSSTTFSFSSTLTEHVE